MVSLGVLAVAVALAGCTSFTTLSRARVLDPGRIEVWAAPEAVGVVSGDGGSIRGIAEAGVRVGATREVELDARLSTLGVTLGPRIQLHRSSDPRSGVDIALAPSVQWTYVDRLAIDTALQVGVNLGEHQLVLAARIAYQVRVRGQRPTSFGYAGGSIGIALRVDPHVTLMPELALATQIAAEPGYASTLANALGVQGSLGLLFDL